MKNSFFLFTVLATFSPMLPGRADIVGYEPFSYRGGLLDGADGGTFWDFNKAAGLPAVHTGKASDWDLLFGAVALSEGELYTADSGAKREYSGITEGIGSEESLGFFDEESTVQTLYYRIDMTRGLGATWCGVSSFSFNNERLFFGLFPDGTERFSIYNQTTFTRLALSTREVVVNEKYTLVARIDINPLGGAGSQLRLYVNPNLNVPENPALAVASAVLPGRNFTTALRVASGGDGLVKWDDLLVTTTWDCLRVLPVTSYADAGPGSLRQVMADVASGGGRVRFPAAEWLFAVSSDQRLLRFSRQAPELPLSNLPVTGLLAGETLLGIDFAENTGELYALGIINPAGVNNGQGRLYRININTAVATRMGTGPFSSTLRSSLGFFGFAWEPGSGQFRVVSESGDNLRVGVTGALAGTDTPLTASGLVGDIAWGPESSSGRTLYGVDLSGNLVRIGGAGGVPSPAGGVVTVVGPPGASGFGGQGGMDITAPGVAWVSSVRAGLLRLNRVNLTTGAATETGTVGDGTFDLTGLAAAPDSIRLLGEINIPASKATIVEGPEQSGLALDGGGLTRLFLLGERPISGPPINKALIAFRNLTLMGGNGDGSTVLRGPGGAINLRSGTLHMDSCTLSGNQANAGAAIAALGGEVRLARCTLTGNTANRAAALSVAGLRMIHCTVSGNHATSTTDDGGIYGAGAVSIDATIAAAPPLVSYSLIAGNISAGGYPPDLSVFGSTATAAFCLIGNGQGSGFGNGSGGSRVGTAVAPLPARVAPAGYYGGNSRTLPLLPDSLAVNLGLASPSRIDQRGLPISGTPDAGAAEYQGSPDLAFYWSTDWDRDGVPFGLENATGTDALRADRASPNELAVQSSSGTPLLTFRLHDAARPYTRWIVRRSFDLITYPDEIYSFNGRTSLNTVGSGIFQGTLGGLISLRDNLPNPPRAFYRLEAQLLP